VEPVEQMKANLQDQGVTEQWVLLVAR
jgi:hypothetical protein